MDQIFISIRTPDRLFYEGKVNTFSSVNDKGIFDMLPGHANFITLIKERISFIQGSTKKELKIGSGILKSSNNSAYIFLDREPT